MEEFMKAHRLNLEPRPGLDIEQAEESGDEDLSDLDGCRLPDSSVRSSSSHGPPDSSSIPSSHEPALGQ